MCKLELMKRLRNHWSLLTDGRWSYLKLGFLEGAALLHPPPLSRGSKFADVQPFLHSVKTRIQLDPATYNRGMIGGFKQVIEKEGAGALLTGFGPTAAGYFLQGAFKFGGYEFFKQQAINQLGYETAANNRTAVYLASSACAEFMADIALCPLEATRIRLVSQPTFASGLLSGFSRIFKEEGIAAFYSGFGPILFKQ
jgi:solute carrier family 25 phosphate transporter 3